VISALSFNNGNDLTLTENTYVWATSTMTVSDANGCNTIQSVTAKFYLASTSNSGSGCTYDGNNCYTSVCVATTTGNQCTGVGDTSVQYDCGFQVWYIAEATDGSAPAWTSSIWSVFAEAYDGTDTGNATNTTETININTLAALSVTSNINYPSTAAGTDTGATNQTATVTNTGNVLINSDVSGTDMTDNGNTIAANNQKFGTSDVTYASLSNTLNNDPANLTLNLSKGTATTSASTINTFWGIAIPGGQAPGSYTGQNTFSATVN
jgi:hypothetical protein